MKFEQITYSLPDFWASALINDDFSGLDDEEEAQINEWLSDNAEDMGQGHWGLEPEQEAGFCKYHDARSVGVLACSCFDYVWNRRV
jgi:hypothetical protein